MHGLIEGTGCVGGSEADGEKYGSNHDGYWASLRAVVGGYQGDLDEWRL